jgi:hypothetical protein
MAIALAPVESHEEFILRTDAVSPRMPLGERLQSKEEVVPYQFNRNCLTNITVA